MKKITQDVIKNCKAKVQQGKTVQNIINYLFSMDFEEAEVLAVMEKLGADKKRIKEILAYDFGLDYETVMGL